MKALCRLQPVKCGYVFFGNLDWSLACRHQKPLR